jgi:hypothetical protein
MSTITPGLSTITPIRGVMVDKQRKFLFAFSSVAKQVKQTFTTEMIRIN